MREGGRYLTQAQRSEIVARARAGEKYESIADSYDIDPSAVGQHARKAGIYRGKVRVSPKKQEWARRQKRISDRQAPLASDVREIVAERTI